MQGPAAATRTARLPFGRSRALLVLVARGAGADNAEARLERSKPLRGFGATASPDPCGTGRAGRDAEGGVSSVQDRASWGNTGVLCAIISVTEQRFGASVGISFLTAFQHRPPSTKRAGLLLFCLFETPVSLQIIGGGHTKSPNPRTTYNCLIL